MSFEYRVVPLPPTWPGNATPAWQRRRAPFKSVPGRALALLGREINMLRGRNVRLAVDVHEGMIRLDGQLYASARPRSPSVIVNFDVADHTLQFPCDRFLYWESNVDAIARAMEKLRAIDRYGVLRGKQYTGFRALPATTAPTMSAREAATIIAGMQETFSARAALDDRTAARDAVRIARSRAHPDRGGSDEAFQRVSLAANVLAAHYGISSL